VQATDPKDLRVEGFLFCCVPGIHQGSAISTALLMGQTTQNDANQDCKMLVRKHGKADLARRLG